MTDRHKILFFFLAASLGLAGCVSSRTYRLDKEAAYHQGRQSVIEKVVGWLEDPDMDKDNALYLVKSLRTGEKMWEIFYVSENFPERRCEKPKPNEWDNRFRVSEPPEGWK